MKGLGRIKNFVLCLFSLACSFTSADAQEEAIKYGDMDNWVVRKITESKIIGGNTKLLYELGPSDTIVGSIPYTNKAARHGQHQMSWQKLPVLSRQIHLYFLKDEVTDGASEWKPEWKE